MHSSTTLRSHPTNILLARLLLPLILLVPTIGFGVGTWRFLFALPLIIAALFGMSIATLEAHDGVLRYRRFLKWTTIRDDEIVATGVLWHPFIGYLRLTRPVFPWGRLYFALDENLDSNPFRRGDYALLRYLRSESVSERIGKTPPANKKTAQAYGLAFVLGLASSLILNYVLPHNPPIPQQNYPALFRIIMYFWRTVETWPWGVVMIALLAGLILRQPFSKHNWILAWAIGFMTAQMGVTAIH